MSTEITSPPPRDSLSRLLEGTWRVMASPRLTLVLLLWLAILVIFSLLIPQTVYQLDDPLQRSRWLSGVPREMWPIAEGLQPWGLFQLLSSVWLRLPLALLLAHSVVMLTASAPAAWQRTSGGAVTSPPGPVALSCLGRQRIVTVETALPGAEASRQLSHRLARAGYRVWLREGDEAWAARRQAHGWLAHTGLYAGLALVAVGLLLQGWLGQVVDVDLQPGQAIRMPGVGRINLIIEAVELPPEARLATDAGIISARVVREVGDEDRFEMPMHQSWLVHGVWLTAVNTLPVVEMSATDAVTGRDVLLQPLAGPGPPQGRVRLPLTTASEERFVGVPAHNVTLRVDYTAAETDAAGQFVVRFFRGVDTSPALVTEIANTEAVEFDGVRYQLSLAHNVRLRLQGGLWWTAAAVGWFLVLVSVLVLAVTAPGWVVGWSADGQRGARLAVVVDELAGERAMQSDLAELDLIPRRDAT